MSDGSNTAGGARHGTATPDAATPDATPPNAATPKPGARTREAQAVTDRGGEAETYEPSPEFVRQRRKRNVAIALSLVAFVVLIFVVTLVRLGANVMDRPI
jgi:hypothetical protein